MNEKNGLGRLGEQFAAGLLEQEGYRIIAKNYSCRQGEIDLISCKGSELFFIEVKTRRSGRFGKPAEAVDRDKQMRLRRAAVCYMQSHPQISAAASAFSFQVIEISVNRITDAF